MTTERDDSMTPPLIPADRSGEHGTPTLPEQDAPPPTPSGETAPLARSSPAVTVTRTPSGGIRVGTSAKTISMLLTALLGVGGVAGGAGYLGSSGGEVETQAMIRASNDQLLGMLRAEAKDRENAIEERWEERLDRTMDKMERAADKRDADRAEQIRRLEYKIDRLSDRLASTRRPVRRSAD